ncbi:glycerol-3-phosphate responsive antiterminator [Paenibacillus sp. ACRRX]|uniref:glycerol-3-phosphate responsive antiterminator n=1 Tax=unclassified Paenibacillus TaxID=185978 RepID=UPI001EF7188F|nr:MULTISPECIES: glycerol-3-phosphate responsive antiterminator [unclassified Paenibacillus]MCG7408176.1 glycerol-3-phosphate responsive antiterminator [Paenibacillus sp. ACRRX]MDK8181441.1 glycerol-3-phosphate responsive antiterminator [Paenibacillus sp. UMB4589-SE434]
MTDVNKLAFPIIASITKPDQIQKAVTGRIRRVILMTGSILQLSSIVSSLQQAGKQVYVHTEMVGGIGRDSHAVQYLAETYKIDGIVSTKSQAIVAARQAGISSIQRIFAIDSSAVETAIKLIGQSKPNEVELMPGLMPRIVGELKQAVNCPLIVGGLIRSQEEIQVAIKSGADYVSIGDSRFW